MSTIQIEGLDRLLAKLGRLESLNALEPPMHGATQIIEAEGQNYPPASHKKMVWKSQKQRRWFFAALRSGKLHVPYRRRESAGHAGGWNSRVTVTSSQIIGVVTNVVPGGAWVRHPTQQAAYHKGTWPTTDDMLAKNKQKIEALFRSAIDKALRS